MTVARRKLIHLDSTPYYHCMARCVRRAFLCGEDHFSGQNYDHRKQWIVEKLKELDNVFAIDICAYAVMSNHYHVVLRVDKARANEWSDRQVIKRWYQLFKGNLLVDKLREGEPMSRAELLAADKVIQTWRERLTDISWYMRCLNESIARMANEEDQCKGRFWEGRFKSQALLDETALLTCMMYVDLNPIRAGINRTPETSDFTSIQARIRAVSPGTKPRKAKQLGSKTTAKKADKLCHTRPKLLPFTGNERRGQSPRGIPFPFKEYLELLDWTGRAIRDDKKGSIPKHIAPIMQRLNINEKEWLTNVQYFEHRFIKAIGPINALRQYGNCIKQSWLKGVGHCAQLYQPRANT